MNHIRDAERLSIVSVSGILVPDGNCVTILFSGASARNIPGRGIRIPNRNGMECCPRFPADTGRCDTFPADIAIPQSDGVIPVAFVLRTENGTGPVGRCRRAAFHAGAVRNISIAECGGIGTLRVIFIPDGDTGRTRNSGGIGRRIKACHIVARAHGDGVFGSGVVSIAEGAGICTGRDVQNADGIGVSSCRLVEAPARFVLVPNRDGGGFGDGIFRTNRIGGHVGGVFGPQIDGIPVPNPAAGIEAADAAVFVFTANRDGIDITALVTRCLFLTGIVIADGDPDGGIFVPESGGRMSGIVGVDGIHSAERRGDACPVFIEDIGVPESDAAFAIPDFIVLPEGDGVIDDDIVRIAERDGAARRHTRADGTGCGIAVADGGGVLAGDTADGGSEAGFILGAFRKGIRAAGGIALPGRHGVAAGCGIADADGHGVFLICNIFVTDGRRPHPGREVSAADGHSLIVSGLVQVAECIRIRAVDGIRRAHDDGAVRLGRGGV